ncbi:MAG TPA: cyclic nucleotide-binding domain-containing protein [Aestuariivirgaceae bacterium]|jgi:CRP-like cAMP-binding protein|nr:cyclic nucleotide-binding domain-containing protein [Aestuariivirgaceae bacterium]
MILKDEVELLRRVPLFAGVEPSKLKLLAFTSDRMSFEAGQTLFEQGDPGDAAYVVLNGSAEVLVNRAGSQIKVADLEKNAIVGEIAILCDVPRTATVRAQDRLETLRISKDQFLRLLAEFPDMAIEIMRVLADRLGRTTAELSEARAQLSRR